MPKRRLKMLVYREVLRLHFELGKSYRTIAEICGLSVGGVHNILERFVKSGLMRQVPAEWDEVTLKRRLYPTTPREVAALDLAALRAEVQQPGVTWQLLWEEYHAAQPDGLSRSAFYRLAQQVERTKPVLKNDYTGGEYLFVDYSGQLLAYWDRDRNASVSVEIFVASWGASSFTYVGASLTQSAQDFVAAHVDAFAYFGCVPRVITPDNLKAAVTKMDRADPEFCHLYRKFAEQYDVVILPARVAKPRDKATAETAVRCVQQRVLAPLRRQQFFSLAEVNAAIAPLRDALNARPMRDYQGQSRQERFQRYDLPAAKPLPVEPWRVTDARYGLRVPSTYLVVYDHHYYSVPHTLIDHHLDLFLVGDVLEIYHHGCHVVRHEKCPPDGRQSVIDAHRPEAHRRVKGRTKEYFLHVAAVIGPCTCALMEGMYARRRHDEEGRRDLRPPGAHRHPHPLARRLATQSRSHPSTQGSRAGAWGRTHVRSPRAA